MLSLVVAMDRGGFIGRDKALPWHLPADLRRFKAITMGKPILMGRRTYESIGRALPGRTNVVISRKGGVDAPGCIVVDSLEAGFAAAGNAEEIMVIGGAAVYAAALPLAERIYLTEVHADIGGDVRFPALEPEEWIELEREDYDADEANAYDLSFVVLERAAAGERA